MLAALGSTLLRFRYYRIIGRFHRLRRMAAVWQRLTDRRDVPAEAHRTSSEADKWLDEIKRHGFCAGPCLGEETVRALRRYAETQPCQSPPTNERFRITQVRDGRTPQGELLAIADVVAPTDCPEARQLAADPLLLETATRFLGYRPKRTRVRLFWSPVSSAADEVRRRDGQTIDFHYDIDACNSFYIYFYLVGGGPTSGAHVVVEGSHGPKPMRIVMGSCFQSEKTVLGLYGADRVTVVTGEPGFCFFEDPACFHKVLAPTESPRLCLQLRYS